MRLGQVLAGGAFALVEVGHRIEPKAVDAHAQPEVDHAHERTLHRGVIEVEIGLVRIESVPVVGLRLAIPGPVRMLEVLEDDPSLLVLLGGVAPHVEVALLAARRRAPRALKPRVLVGRVVQDQLGHDPQPAAVGLLQEMAKVRAAIRSRGAPRGSRRCRTHRLSSATDRRAKARGW